MRSILRSDLMIIKTPQNVHKICFWGVLVTFTSEVKFDLIKFEPHYVKFFFFPNLLHSQGVWHFDIWQIISKSNMSCHMHPLTPAHPSPTPNKPACVILTLLDILNIGGYHRNPFQGYSLHWSSSFIMTQLKQSWQYWHSCIVESL